MRKTIFIYGVTLAAVAMATVVRWLLDPVLGDQLPFPTFFVAVVAAAWIGGLRPALLATGLGFFVAWYCFTPSRFLLSGTSGRQFLGLGMYLMVSFAIAAFGEAVRVNRRRFEELAQLQEEAFRPSAPISEAVLLKHQLRDVAVIGFGLTVLVLLIGGLQGYRSAQKLNDDSRMVTHTHEVIGSLETLLSTLKDAETGQRGYLLVEDERYLEPYDDALSRVQVELARLRELTSDNAEQQARLAVLDQKIRVRLDELKQTVALMKRKDRLAALKLVHNDYGKALMDDVRKDVAAMQHVEHVLLKKRADESESTFRTTILSILLPAIIGIVLVGVVFYLSQRNLRQRQRAALVLAEQKERLRTTLASIGDGVISTDQNGNVTYLNAVAESLTGWTNIEAVGVPLTEVFRIVNESTREPVENPALRALKEGVIVGLANHTILIAKDGTERPIDDSAAPIRCVEGELVGCVLVFRDITDRNTAEDQLRHLAATLAEADRRKDEFLATLAHELRNPLAPIRNGLQVMKLANGNAEAVEQSRIMMERQLEQMVRLVDDLLDVSRISRGKLELKINRLQLADVVSSAVETSRPVIDQMGHELTVKLPMQPIVIDADFTRLAQVFQNLINNAAKYSNPGGHILLTCERQGSDVVVSVQDNGIGIAADQMPHIFEMFSQVDRSLEKSQGGLGIGLTLVRRLVEMHGGRVEAQSEGSGKGSEFVVRLPVVIDALVAQSPIIEEKQNVSKPPLRILIVDDNRDSADTLGMMLKIMGNETCTAYDGEEAVAAAIRFRPDVILLDIGLPNLNGYEACRRIREQPGGTALVIIAQTGWGQESDRQRTRDAGFDHHMVKPIDSTALMKILAGLSDAASR